MYDAVIMAVDDSGRQLPQNVKRFSHHHLQGDNMIIMKLHIE